MESITNSEMDIASSSSGMAQAAVTKLVGPPYRRRAKNAVLNDPTLEQVMGTKEKALDVGVSSFIMWIELIAVFALVRRVSRDQSSQP